METRNIEQMHVYGLILNTFGRAEDGKLVGSASSLEALKEWYDGELLEKPETIDGWHYSFKEGLLRNSNPLYSWNHAKEDSFGHGWFDDWVEVGSIPDNIYKVDF